MALAPRIFCAAAFRGLRMVWKLGMCHLVRRYWGFTRPRACCPRSDTKSSWQLDYAHSVHTALGVPQELPFLPSPTPGFNPTQWTPTQRSEYAKSTLLFNTLPNVIFFGMAVILLAMFLIWCAAHGRFAPSTHCCPRENMDQQVRTPTVLCNHVKHPATPQSMHSCTQAAGSCAVRLLRCVRWATRGAAEERAVI